MTDKDITKREYEVLQSMEFNEDILITDPCYIIKDEDWDYSRYGELDRIGIKKYITNTTYYGDWSCTVWKASNYDKCISENEIGEFCADTAKVSVVSYKEAKRYNKELEKWIENHDWCTTVIPNFKGTVEMRYFEEEREWNGIKYNDRVLQLFGLVDGKVVWIAAQTGF